MRVVLVGSGNVAAVLGHVIQKAGHDVLQVVSMHIANARSLGEQLQCSFTDNFSAVDTRADIYIVAIPDSALADLHEHFHVGNKLVVHTAGAVSRDALKEVSLNYGVLYPLQSLSKEQTDIRSAIPLLVDGNSDEVISQVEDFAKTLSGIVTRSSDEERLKLHIAAVLVNNFTNHLYAMAADFCEKESIDFRMLQPLIEETALRLRNGAPNKMQTGPAIRKDIVTLDKHLRILAAYPKLKMVYMRMTDIIMNP